MKFTIPLNVSAQYVFKVAKYTPHKKGNGFIKEAKEGRYHALYYGHGQWDLHFDIYGSNGHWSPYMPYTCGKELSRLVGIAKRVAPVKLLRVYKEKEKKTMNDGKVLLIHQVEAAERRRKKKLLKEEARKERKRLEQIS